MTYNQERTESDMSNQMLEDTGDPCLADPTLPDENLSEHKLLLLT